MLIPLSNLVNNYNLLQNISGVIHIGGHIGEEVPLYLEYNWNVMIFEPQLKCFEKIPNHNKVLKYNCALGSEEKELNFYLASNGESSSFLKPNLHLQEHPHITFPDECTIKQYPLDNFDTNNYQLLNLDVQGYELEVLKGSERTLNSIKYIYSEVNTKNLYDGCVMLDKLDNWLKERHFIRKETQLTSHGWGDAFYIKE